KSFFIRYYERKTYPANLNEIKNGQTLSSELSKIYFLKDTCTIRSDGSRPDNSIMFGSKIGDKRVGAMLPNDYEPEKEE
ncbi:MAG: hypothetical protein PHS40_12575, partial [Mariniphaga sp.]|nr:hypothetical protein [Mariniphaga sp.]